MRRGKPVTISTLYVDDAPSAAHHYLFGLDGLDGLDDDAQLAPASVWRRDVLVDEERSPLVAAVVCAARLVGAEPMLVHVPDDSDDEEAERDLDASCSLAQCATLLGVTLARVYPPTPACVARAISGGSPVLVVHDGTPCVLHTVDASGELGAERFETCVGTAARFTPRDVRHMFGFWAPVPEAEDEAESESDTESAKDESPEAESEADAD